MRRGAGIGAGLSSGMVGAGDIGRGARGLGDLGAGAGAARLEEEEKRMMEELRQREMAKPYGMKKGGKVKKMKSGGYVKSADGCAKKGKTKGRFV